MKPFDSDILEDLLKLNDSGYIFHRERSNLEFKESFSLAGLAEYFKDFAGFSNNQGGYLIFGIKNSPRIPAGLSESSKEMFEKIDPETISGHLNEIFSPAISWEQREITLYNRTFGIIYIAEAKSKPVIAKKDEGRNVIKNGEVYYRYAGRTQKIEYAELESIINNRVEENNQHWLDLMAKIGKIGPSKAAILDTEKGVIEKDTNNILVLDNGLIDKIKFIREGQFDEKDGATTLKLVGEVLPIDQVEVTKVLRKNITDLYPYSYTEMFANIRSNLENVKQNEVNEIIKINDLKNNRAYCAYNFRTKQQEEKYNEDGIVPSTAPTLYNESAIEFIVSRLAESRTKQ